MAGISVTGSSQFASQAVRTGLILDYENQFRWIALMQTADPDNEGSASRAVIPVLESPGADRGTNMKVRFQRTAKKPIGIGYGVNPLGVEDAPVWDEYSFDINYQVLAKGAEENIVFDQNVVEWSLSDSNNVDMARRAARIMEFSIAHQLAGYTPVNAAAYTSGGTSYMMSLHNPCTAPDTAHHYFCPDNSGDNTTEALVAADPSSWLTSRFVNQVLARVTSESFVDNPLGMPTTPWGDGYVLMCDKEGMRQVKENTSDSDIYDLTRACIEGGMPIENTALWKGEGFKINNVFYLECDHMPFGCSGETPGATTTGTAISNVRRAVLLGCRAMHVRYGMGFTDGMHLGYSVDKTHRRQSMIIDSVFGGKVTIPDSAAQRWGSVVISHYTPATIDTSRDYV